MTNAQSVIELEKEACILRNNYINFLTKIVLNKNKNIEPTFEEILKCQRLGNEYFNFIEQFVGNSGLLGAHRSDEWIISFAETCSSILNTHIEHIKFLRTYKYSFNKIEIEPDKYSFANMKRIVKEYLPKTDILKLKNDFIENKLPIYGFENKSFLINIKLKWRELSMIEKIGMLGSIASIVGLLLYFMPSDLPSNSINYKQSPVMQNNYGNITYNINNSITNNTIKIRNKINLQLNKTMINLKGIDKVEQKEINTKIFILSKSKEINKKNITIKQKNLECKDKAYFAKNLFKYELSFMNKICDKIF